VALAVGAVESQPPLPSVAGAPGVQGRPSLKPVARSLVRRRQGRYGREVYVSRDRRSAVIARLRNGASRVAGCTPPPARYTSGSLSGARAMAGKTTTLIQCYGWRGSRGARAPAASRRKPGLRLGRACRDGGYQHVVGCPMGRPRDRVGGHNQGMPQVSWRVSCSGLPPGALQRQPPKGMQRRWRQ